MKKTLTTIIICLLCSFMAYAQKGEITRLDFEVRADYMQEYQHNEKIDAQSGFKGKYINLRLDGKINDSFSYSFRQRLIKPISDASYFDATDWATLTYSNRNWSISAGKQVVGIGGYEYDYIPIDVYFGSEFWNTIACYQFGASATYSLDNGKDSFLIQFCESPFRRNALNIERKEMFAYNFMWMGSRDIFQSLYSINVIEYLPGRFINYIAAGNQFRFSNLEIRIDAMHRALCSDFEIGKNMSFIGEIYWNPIDRLNVFAKFSYDFNHSDKEGDLCILPGTDITRIGGGIEYFPIKDSKSVRLHLNCCYTFGTSPATAALRPDQTIIDAGVTWKVNLLNIKRKNR